nr:tetratricopeptide repeat protein [Bacteroidota bacterium]
MLKGFKIHIWGIVYFCILSLLPPSLFSQELSTHSKRAEKYYNSGRAAFNQLNYTGAEKDLLKSISIDTEFLEAYMLLGDVYREQGKSEQALSTYSRVIEIDADKYPEAGYFSGLVYWDIANYPMSMDLFRKFIQCKGISKKRKQIADYYIRCSEFA